MFAPLLVLVWTDDIVGQITDKLVRIEAHVEAIAKKVNAGAVNENDIESIIEKSLKEDLFQPNIQVLKYQTRI